MARERGKGESESYANEVGECHGGGGGDADLCRYSGLCKYHRDPQTDGSHLINTDWKVSPELSP